MYSFMPVINVAVVPITQLNIAVLSSAPQLNAASVGLGGAGAAPQPAAAPAATSGAPVVAAGYARI